MSTNSRIAVELPGGTAKSIYCHFDGYPDWVGKVLLKHYRDRDKVMALMDLGDLSSLGRELGDKHSFDQSPRDGWCTAYGRDRGETGTEAAWHVSLEDGELWDQEYLYLFRQDGKWYWAEPCDDDGKYDLKLLRPKDVRDS